VLGGDVRDILLLDVTPLSLGVETQGGVTDRLIDRNTTIPTKKARTYTTAVDNQTEVTINILQGERPMAKDNKSLGQFNLTGIPPAPARTPQVEVTFDIDANGILNVSAKELATGNEQKITITGSGNLGEQEIDRMVKEAEANAERDAQLRRYAELRNEADRLVSNVERALRDLGDKASEAERADIEEKIANVKSAMEREDHDGLKEAVTALEAASHSLTERLYQQAGEPAEEPVGAGVGGAKDDVIDAEFKEEK
jgi:molecular chaperone DnaK